MSLSMLIVIHFLCIVCLLIFGLLTQFLFFIIGADKQMIKDSVILFLKKNEHAILVGLFLIFALVIGAPELFFDIKAPECKEDKDSLLHILYFRVSFFLIVWITLTIYISYDELVLMRKELKDDAKKFRRQKKLLRRKLKVYKKKFFNF